MENRNNQKIIIIGGPTATGKSKVALIVAEKMDGEIISGDSRQFFKEITIGTDKVPDSYRKRVPHHLIDIFSLKEKIDVFKFIEMTIEKTKEIISRDKIPIIVGGSGLYLRSLIEGIFYIPEDVKEKQEEIRKELEKLKTSALYEKLKEIDPEASEKIHRNDRRRIRRAIEVYYLTGKKISEWQKSQSKISLSEIGKIFYFILFRKRELLYERINERVDRMFEKGWIEEVKNLIEKSYEKFIMEKAPIGYREIVEYIKKDGDIEELKNKIKKKTREYARKQLTWFKKEKGIWLEVKDEEKTAEEIIKIVEEGKCL